MDLLDKNGPNGLLRYRKIKSSIWSIWSIWSIKCRYRNFQAGNQYEFLSQTVEEAEFWGDFMRISAFSGSKLSFLIFSSYGAKANASAVFALRATPCQVWQGGL
jgi:hypothetical protein